jgi:hypothetical protein
MKVSMPVAGVLLSALDDEFGRGAGMEVVIGGLPSLESRCAVRGACAFDR